MLGTDSNYVDVIKERRGVWILKLLLKHLEPLILSLNPGSVEVKGNFVIKFKQLGYFKCKCLWHCFRHLCSDNVKFHAHKVFKSGGFEFTKVSCGRLENVLEQVNFCMQDWRLSSTHRGRQRLGSHVVTRKLMSAFTSGIVNLVLPHITQRVLFAVLNLCYTFRFMLLTFTSALHLHWGVDLCC